MKIHGNSRMAEYVRCRHKRVDSNGYPRSLKTDQIPVQSRILSIAEAYDSMTGSCSYRKPFSRFEAIKELQDNKNTQFDQHIADVFIRKLIDANCVVI